MWIRTRLAVVVGFGVVFGLHPFFVYSGLDSNIELDAVKAEALLAPFLTNQNMNIRVKAIEQMARVDDVETADVLIRLYEELPERETSESLDRAAILQQVLFRYPEKGERFAIRALEREIHTLRSKSRPAIHFPYLAIDTILRYAVDSRVTRPNLWSLIEDYCSDSSLPIHVRIRMVAARTTMRMQKEGAGAREQALRLVRDMKAEPFFVVPWAVFNDQDARTAYAQTPAVKKELAELARYNESEEGVYQDALRFTLLNMGFDVLPVLIQQLENDSSTKEVRDRLAILTGRLLLQAMQDKSVLHDYTKSIKQLENYATKASDKGAYDTRHQLSGILHKLQKVGADDAKKTGTKRAEGSSL